VAPIAGGDTRPQSRTIRGPPACGFFSALQFVSSSSGFVTLCSCDKDDIFPTPQRPQVAMVAFMQFLLLRWSEWIEFYAVRETLNYFVRVERPPAKALNMFDGIEGWRPVGTFYAILAQVDAGRAN
jgi:hypothetical protein